MWKYLLLLSLLVVLIPQGVVLSGNLTDYANITVSAQGYVGTAPSNLTVTYISDYEVGLEWISGTYNTTMVRAAYGRPVENVSDGIEVYVGNATSTTFWIPNVGMVGPLHFRAFSMDKFGNWDPVGTTAEGDFMSISFLFSVVTILGLVLFIAAFRWKDLLLSYAAALTWMAIGFWWIVGDLTNFGLSEAWSQILIFVPFVLSFSVLLRLMNTEIRHEAQGQSWTEVGGTPREAKLNRTIEYRKALRKRLGG